MRRGTPAPPIDMKAMLARALEMHDEAIAEGRHSLDWETMCDGCREWVKGIFHNDEYSGKRLCRKCAEAAGVR